MRFPRHTPTLHPQRGASLMVMLVILVIGVSALLVGSLNSSALNNSRQQQTAAALAQAKDALIGYAITYGDNHSGQVHGYLPCPDYGGGNPEGSAEPVCGIQNVSVIGRLPWATLDLPTLRDGNGECLWYAVSGTYKNNPKTGLMNWDTNGQLLAYASDGTLLTPPDNQVVAVIFAPGAPQPGQNRSGTTAPVCGGNYTATNYLDSGIVNGSSYNNADIVTGKFIQGANGGIVNDQMVFITRQDIWNAIQKRTDFQLTSPNNPLIQMTTQVALCLANYGKHNSPNDNNSLPWPAPLSLSDYADNTKYDDSAFLYAGRVPYSVTTSKAITSNSFSNLMTTATCPAGWAGIDPWWNNWKDHLFYAISQAYKPTNYTNQDCGTCLQINGSGQYAAVVMFASSRLVGQVRASDTTGANSIPRGTISNYLEGNNTSNFSGANGNENYQTGSASSTFNDVSYCIDQNLNVTPC
ncbi:MAG: hypothetical protein HKM01_08790 [Gallionella sp.]|nr:hypothetical protein [Gallionella sp.]